MSPLTLVGILVITTSAFADVKHVLEGSAHPPDPNSINHLATNPPYWWMNSNSPLKAAYDYYKKCNAKGNCLAPINPAAPSPQPFQPQNTDVKPQNIDVKNNPFLNGNYQPSSGNANFNDKIDIKKNPFLSGTVVTTGSGVPLVKDENGFIGVQPAQPFKKPGFATTHPLEQKKKPGFATTHPLEQKKPGNILNVTVECKGAGFACVEKSLCLNGVVNTNGEGLLQVRSDIRYCHEDTEVCCQMNNLNEITAGKSAVPVSTIKFGGGSGFSPGLIHVQPLNVQPDITFGGEHGHHSSSSTSKSIRDTSLTPNSVFGSTVDYSDTKFDSDVRFASTFQGPAYLPPVAPTSPAPKPNVNQQFVPSRPSTAFVQPTTPRPTPPPYRPPSTTSRPAPSTSREYLPPRESTPRPATTVTQYVPPRQSFPSVTPQRPYQPSVTPQQPYQPSVTPQRPYQPSVTPQQTYQPSVTTQRPYQPSVTPQQPYQPSVTPQRPSVTPQQPYQPSVTPQRPYQPSVTPQKPYQPSVTPQQPYQPSVTPQRPYQPSVTTQRPYQPSVTTRPYQPSTPQQPQRPYQPSVTPQQPYQPSVTPQQPYQPSVTPQRPYQPPQQPQRPYQPSVTPQQPYQPSVTPQRPYQPSPSTPRPYQPTTSREYLPPRTSQFVPQPSSPRPNPFVPQQTTPRPVYTSPTQPRPPPTTPRPVYTSPSQPTEGYSYPSPGPTSPPFRPTPSVPRFPSPSTPGYQYPSPQQPSTNYVQPSTPSRPAPTQRPYQPPATPTQRPYQPPVPSTQRPYQPPTQRPTPGPSTVGGYDYPKPTPTFGYPSPRPDFGNSNVNNQYIPPPRPTKRPGENPDQIGDSDSIDETQIKLQTPRPEVPNELPPPAGCAAALKCVQEIYCTAEGVISPVPVVLTKEQELLKVPTTECQDTESGIIGKCCRDPNYKDPWPSANLVDGVDDGQYKEDANLGQYQPDLQRNVRSDTSTNVAAPSCGERHLNTKPPGPGPLDVNFAEIPWQAMVLRDSNRSLLCGGVIVRRDAVLTAAHCIEGLETSDILIKGGEWKLGIDEEPLPFQIVKVAVVVRHPQYQKGSFVNDLALLVLQEKLRLSKNIGTLCLPPPNQIPTKNCIATGWGKRILQLHAKGAIMHAIGVKIMDNQQCQETLTSTFQHAVSNYSPNTLCGYSDIDQCRVDYGSALACSDGGSYTLSGIFAWDTGCKQSGQIGGYIAPDVEWIESTLSKPIKQLKTLNKN